MLPSSGDTGEDPPATLPSPPGECCPLLREAGRAEAKTAWTTESTSRSSPSCCSRGARGRGSASPRIPLRSVSEQHKHRCGWLATQHKQLHKHLSTLSPRPPPTHPPTPTSLKLENISEQTLRRRKKGCKHKSKM